MKSYASENFVPPLKSVKTLPPTLLQGGTREVFLSDYIEFAKHPNVTLDLTDGMWHVFQLYTALPETQAAFSRIKKFIS